MKPYFADAAFEPVDFILADTEGDFSVKHGRKIDIPFEFFRAVDELGHVAVGINEGDPGPALGRVKFGAIEQGAPAFRFQGVEESVECPALFGQSNFHETATAECILNV